MSIFSFNAQSIVDEMKESLHRDINFMDEEGMIIASTDPARLGTHHPGASRILHEGLEELVIEESTEDGMRPGINLPIHMEGKAIGVIGITGKPSEVYAFGEVIQKMTEIMLQSIQAKEEQRMVEDARLQFMEYWLFSKSIDIEELQHRAAFFGLKTTVPWVVVFLDIHPREEAATASNNPELNYSRFLRCIRGVLKEEQCSVCFPYGSNVVVLLQTDSVRAATDTIRAVKYQLSGFPISFSGGISSVAKQPLDIRRCFQEARTAALAARENRSERLIRYDETSLEFIAHCIDLSIGRNLVNITFFNCRKEEIAEFAEIILLYFQKGGSLDKMAEQLYVHRNTIQYRIEQLRKRTGYDLRLPRDACVLYFAAVFYKRTLS